MNKIIILFMGVLGFVLDSNSSLFTALVRYLICGFKHHGYTVN